MPQRLEKGGIITFRRMFKDSTPIVGEVVLIGFDAVAVRIGIAGITDESELLVLFGEICSVC